MSNFAEIVEIGCDKSGNGCSQAIVEFESDKNKRFLSVFPSKQSVKFFPMNKIKIEIRISHHSFSSCACMCIIRTYMFMLSNWLILRRCQTNHVVTLLFRGFNGRILLCFILLFIFPPNSLQIEPCSVHCYSFR